MKTFPRVDSEKQPNTCMYNINICTGCKKLKYVEPRLVESTLT